MFSRSLALKSIMEDIHARSAKLRLDNRSEIWLSVYSIYAIVFLLAAYVNVIRIRPTLCTETGFILLNCHQCLPSLFVAYVAYYQLIVLFTTNHSHCMYSVADCLLYNISLSGIYYVIYLC